MIPIGKKVKYLRCINELNQTELAKAVGIHRYSLVDLEKGTVQPPPDLIEKFSQVFKIDIESEEVDRAFNKLVKGDSNA